MNRVFVGKGGGGVLSKQHTQLWFGAGRSRSSPQQHNNASRSYYFNNNDESSTHTSYYGSTISRRHLSSSTSTSSSSSSSSSLKSKYMSTATAAAVAYEEDVNSSSNSMVVEPTTTTIRRPRLEALRTTLEQETTSGTMKNTNDMIHKWSSSSSSTSTTTTTTTSSSSSKKESQQTLDQILQHLEHLPPPPQEHMLVDNYQRHHTYLRISLTERCNLRCLYCMPPEGVPLQPSPQLLTGEEILQLGQYFVKGGVDKLRFTGGEPLLRQDLPDIMAGFSSMTTTGNGNGIQQMGMTTNGVTLSKKLPTLIDAGLTHVNISLDTLKADKFTELTRRPAFSKVMKSIETACDLLNSSSSSSPPHRSGESPQLQGRVKINCVVMKDCNDDELQEFVKLTTKYPVDVRFIEWMPFSENGWNSNRFVSYQDMLTQLVEPLGLERVEDGPNDTTKWWTLPTTENPQGRIGFITSMSNHFCDTCNRVRLTADGQLKVCLFGSAEVSLRDALRRPDVTDVQMEHLIHYALSKKHAKLGGHGSAQGIANANDNRPMTLIGG
jgi:molybdenum cofactor biosynthesis enzyme MoaA